MVQAPRPNAGRAEKSLENQLFFVKNKNYPPKIFFFMLISLSYAKNHQIHFWVPPFEIFISSSILHLFPEKKFVPKNFVPNMFLVPLRMLVPKTFCCSEKKIWFGKKLGPKKNLGPEKSSGCWFDPGLLSFNWIIK